MGVRRGRDQFWDAETHMFDHDAYSAWIGSEVAKQMDGLSTAEIAERLGLPVLPRREAPNDAPDAEQRKALGDLIAGIVESQARPEFNASPPRSRAPGSAYSNFR